MLKGRSTKKTRATNEAAASDVSAARLPVVTGWIAGQPLYKELKRQLSDALHQGVWNPGEVIPSEQALHTHYGVSIGTVRKAIDELVAENSLVRQQGRGTFVTSHETMQYFFAFFRIVSEDGKFEFPSVELLRFESHKADVALARTLGIGVAEKVLCFINRLSLRGKPVLIDKITVPATLFPGLNEQQLMQRTSTVYSFYQKKFGVNVVRS